MTIDRESPFWQSVDQRAMALPFCKPCRHFFFYPRPFCPTCWSPEIEHRPVSSKGKVWSHTVVHFPHGANEGWKTRVPYVVALITLDEDVRMMSNVVDCDPASVHAGMAVELAYREYEDQILPVFAPAG
jgi:uncharacterized OB-fold protein